jgi:uroporphyrinogen-III synthase
MSAPRIGLLEGRMSGELASLARRHCLEPMLAPAVRQVALDAAAPVAELLDSMAAGAVDAVVFLTGVGTSALFEEAQRLGRLAQLEECLRRTTNICRGQKPWSLLKRHGVPIAITAERPYTTAELLRALDGLPPSPGELVVLHYGERNIGLTDALEAAGRRLRQICLYEWRLPEDTRPLETLIEEVIAGELEAVAFTSQIQVRHLFEVAARRGRAVALLHALTSQTVVAAVGPSCAAGLESIGVTPDVVPANPKMGPMIVALAERLRSGPTPDLR